MGVSEPNEPAQTDPADLGFPPVQAEPDPTPAVPTPTPGLGSAPDIEPATESGPAPESPSEQPSPTESPAPSSPAEDPPAPEPTQEPAPAETQPEVPTEPAPAPQEAPSASQAPPSVPGPATTHAIPVRVDNMSRRSDNDALEGLFCDIVSGPYEGRVGVFDRVLEFDKSTGYPKRILVITRDADNLMLDVAYEDARPSSSTGSR